MSVETKKEPIKFDAFGHVCPPPCPVTNDDGMMKRYKVKVDKFGNTRIVEDEPLNLYKQIQSQKNKCGVEMARKLIKNGLVPADYYADKGKDFGDVTVEQYDLPELSESVNESKKLFDELGIKDQKSLNEYIKATVAEQVAASQKKEVKEDAK